LRKIFRTSQRIIEKEFTNLQTAAEQHAKKAVQIRNDDTEMLSTIDNTIAKVESLKRKVLALSDLPYNLNSDRHFQSLKISAINLPLPCNLQCEDELNIWMNLKRCKVEMTPSGTSGLTRGWIGGLWIGPYETSMKEQLWRLLDIVALRYIVLYIVFWSFTVG
jgi:hypothetical protein